MIRKEHVAQVCRFLVVGGTVMVFNVSLVWLLSRWLGRQASFLLAYPPTLAIHFSLHKWWTFGCRRTDTVRQVTEYLALVAVTFVIQWVVYTTLGALTSLPPWMCAGGAIAAQMSVNFLVMRQRVFARVRI